MGAATASLPYTFTMAVVGFLSHLIGNTRFLQPPVSRLSFLNLAWRAMVSP